MRTHAPISVIIPNYNGETILPICLPRTLKELEKAGITDIILIDDCSTDRSVEWVATQFPSVRLIKNSQNMGFSNTCNRASEYAKEEILLFLNSDVTIKDILVNDVIHLLNDSKIFAISPPIIRKKDHRYINETPSRGYFKGGWINLSNGIHHSPESVPDRSCPQPILWACGGAMFVKKDRFLAFDGFDDMYHPFYKEDLDLCYRAWKQNLRSIYAPVCHCDHRHQSSIGTHFSQRKIENVSIRNHYIFTWKNLTYPPYVMLHILSVIIKLLTFQRDIPIIFDALKRLPKILRYRRSQRGSVLSDKDILNAKY